MGWIGLITIIGIIQISYIYAPVSGLIWIILSIPASVWIVVKILRNFSFEFINIFKTPTLVFPIIFTWIIFLYFSTLDSNYYDLGLYYEQFGYSGNWKFACSIWVFTFSSYHYNFNDV